MAEKKTGSAKHSKDYRDRKREEFARIGIDRVRVDMPAGTQRRLTQAMKLHGYSELQELLQDMQLSFLAVDPEEQARRLKRPDAPAFRISAKLARHFEEASMAELRRDPGTDVVSPSFSGDA